MKIITDQYGQIAVGTEVVGATSSKSFLVSAISKRMSVMAFDFLAVAAIQRLKWRRCKWFTGSINLGFRLQLAVQETASEL